MLATRSAVKLGGRERRLLPFDGRRSTLSLTPNRVENGIQNSISTHFLGLLLGIPNTESCSKRAWASGWATESFALKEQ